MRERGGEGEREEGGEEKGERGDRRGEGRRMKHRFMEVFQTQRIKKQFLALPQRNISRVKY